MAWWNCCCGSSSSSSSSSFSSSFSSSSGSLKDCDDPHVCYIQVYLRTLAGGLGGCGCDVGAKKLPLGFTCAGEECVPDFGGDLPDQGVLEVEFCQVCARISELPPFGVNLSTPGLPFDECRAYEGCDPRAVAELLGIRPECYCPVNEPFVCQRCPQDEIGGGGGGGEPPI